MAIDTNTLVKILDDAVRNSMDHAIENYGSSLTEEEQKNLHALTPEQSKDALSNLVEANKSLGRLLWFDNNNNN